jgi:hypothetical protein
MVGIHQVALGQRLKDVIRHFIVGTGERHSVLLLRDDGDGVDLRQEIGVG